MADLPGEHLCFPADARTWDALKPLIALGRERGGFAGAVCCAGSHQVRPLSLVDTERLHEAFDANFVTAINATKLVVKAPSAKGGSVVWLSSVAAERATTGFLGYAAAKGALVSAARVAALELAPRKIRVNTILAGVVDTPMSSGWMDLVGPEQKAAIAKSHPLGIGTPDSVASVISFFLSEQSAWVTGATLIADGGLSMR